MQRTWTLADSHCMLQVWFQESWHEIGIAIQCFECLWISYSSKESYLYQPFLQCLFALIASLKYIPSLLILSVPQSVKKKTWKFLTQTYRFYYFPAHRVKWYDKSNYCWILLNAIYIPDQRYIRETRKFDKVDMAFKSSIPDECKKYLTYSDLRGLNRA